MGSVYSRASYSALPTEESHRRALPPRPASTCKACWEGPFAAHLGLFRTPVDSKWVGRRRIYTGGYTYYTSNIRLKWRAANCVWCGLIRATLHTHRDRFPSRSCNLGYLKITVGSPTTEYEYHRGYIPAGLQGFSIFVNNLHLFTGYVHADKDDPAAQYIPLPSPILDVRSLHALSSARRCIDECVHGHERCLGLSTSPDQRLPTRVIDCSDMYHPRLVSTEGTAVCKIIGPALQLTRRAQFAQKTQNAR
ncbi:hypothetical protein BV20DRAFT_367610 [Pilatotrama ljubarskyi]|nr:hypothetical protein BV20DRAFT_367610 [Pilatotrama ljubarskyi]